MVTSRGSQGSAEDWPRRPRLFSFFAFFGYIFQFFENQEIEARVIDRDRLEASEVCFYDLNLKGAKSVMDCLHGLMIISSLS